jgi:hypothetical protein
MKGVHFLERKVSELFKNGQKKCPKIKSADILWTKGAPPYHILKLPCGHQKNNFHFVTISFFYKSI